MYSREQIEKVRSSVDIVEVVREYVPSLTVSGRSVRGLCPFHSERTPSFHVQPEKGFYKCFGCGEAGDVIGFVAKLESVNFSEALEKLAGQAGVVLQKSHAPQEKRQDDVKDKLYRVLEEAQRLYQQTLGDERLGAAARSYLDERGVTEETRRKFQLGAAPSSGASIFETLVKKGFAFELCQQAGLVARSKSGRFYDPLFARVIFPIFDSFGHPVGFGGRVLPQSKKSVFGEKEDVNADEGPKYINSPESPVFQKGRLLYGLNQGKASILARRRAMIMEGYMDVIGAHQGGFDTAVATLGTAFTRDHAKLLKRYADETVIFFDADEAGRRAVTKSLEPMIQEGLFPRVVLTDETLDPDELILDKGPETFQKIVDASPDFVGYLLKVLVAGDVPTLQKKSEIANFIMTLVSQVSNDVLRTEWTQRVALGLGLNQRSLEEQFNKKGADVPAAAKAPAIKKFLPSAEEEYLQLAFLNPEFLSHDEISEADFLEARQKNVFRLMLGQMSQMGKLSLPLLTEQAAPQEKEWMLELFLEDKKFDDPSTRREQLARDIRIKRDKERLAGISQQLKMSSTPNSELQAEYQILLRRIKGSK